MSESTPHVEVAVVGAGFSGIAAAARLLAEGADVAVFERAERVGGVWRDNVYPGAACDVESHLYALKDVPNPGWSRWFAGQPEILGYLERTAADLGVGEHVHLGHEVLGAAWDDAAAVWRIETSRGPWTADLFVAALGALAEPQTPDLPGLGAFAGPVLHTARWDPDLDLAGKDVAVVGTGASAVQLVPAIQPAVGRLTLFQRTPAWVMPRNDRALSDRVRRRYGRRPVLQRLTRRALYAFHETYGLAFRHPRLAAVLERLARAHLAAHVPDRALRQRLTPGYRFGCKRVLTSDDYYPALVQDNVTVTGAAAEVRAGAVVDADGTAHPADVLVFATGFHIHDSPATALVTGRHGERLADVWQGAPTAHVGTTIAGFPNFFMLQGPNTGLGHSSVLLMIEAQIDHVVGALRFMRANRVAAIEPTERAQAAFVAEVDELARDTVWTSGGCRSWYLDHTGRNAAIWPGSVGAFRKRVAPFYAEDYHARAAS